MIRNTKAVALMGVLAIALTGCSRSADEVPPPENMTADNYAVEAAPTPEPLPPENVAPAAPAPVDLNASAAEALPPETTPSEDEQMADDASATGMTARASRDQPAEDATTGGNFSDR
jgi:type IV secretory pathway VirB10-like protein